MQLKMIIPIFLALLMAGCGAPASAPLAGKFTATDITGVSYGKDFHLHDLDGRPRRLADFRGKVVLLYFGYTHCPDACPTALAKLAQVRKALGRDGDRVQVLFVTLDPKRDTPQTLKQYLPYFDPAFLGLRGNAAATAQMAKDFHVYYAIQPADTKGNYSVDHTAATFAYDPQGRLRLFISDSQPVAAITHDVKRLLND